MSEKCPKCGATMLPAFQSAIQKMLGSVVTGIGGEIVCLKTDGMDCLLRRLAQAQEKLAAEAARKRNVQTIADATEAEWKEHGNG